MHILEQLFLYKKYRLQDTSRRTGPQNDGTVALIEFASSSLRVKVHLKKNPEAEKLDGSR